MDGLSIAAILEGVGAVAIPAVIAYFTTQTKFRWEQKKASEDWRSTILEKYYSDFDTFQKVAQQFAIGIIFYEDPSRQDHHQKIFIPKNFNLTLGRDAFNDIRATDPTVSRLHALLTSDNADTHIEDLFATNKTMVNGKPISKRTKLDDGDEISIGQVILRYRKVSGWIS